MLHAPVRDYLNDLAAAALVAPAAVGVSAQHLDLIHEGVRTFQHALMTAQARDWKPSQVPSSIGYTNASTELGHRLLALAPALPWTPARQDPTGADRALLSINDMFALGPITAGFVLVQPHSVYPLHHHPPQELYLTVEGTAEWRFGGAEETVSVAPGRVFYNPPGVLHEQRNGDSTNISLYVLWPGDPG